MNPNKRPPPSSVGAFEGGDGIRDATKRARDFPDGKILRPGQEQPGNVLLVRVTDIVHPVRDTTKCRCIKCEPYEVAFPTAEKRIRSSVVPLAFRDMGSGESLVSEATKQRIYMYSNPSQSLPAFIVSSWSPTFSWRSDVEHNQSRLP